MRNHNSYRNSTAPENESRAACLKRWSLESGGGPYPSKSCAEIDAEMCEPRVILYLDHIAVTNSDGVECRIELLPEDQIKTKKRAKKPAAPKTCPHCGMSLTLKAA